jgi:glycosyltransferase involved in cell wall biosynthesis
MKVLNVIPSVSPLRGGPSRAIVDMECALSLRGIAVTTVATNDDGDNDRALAVPCGVPIKEENATRWYFPKTTNFYTTSVGLGRWLPNNIVNYDLIHVHALFSFAPVVAAYLARLKRIPYVVRPLGALSPYGMTKRRSLLKRLSLSIIERRILEGASAVHFTSLAEKQEAEALGLHFNGVVVPLGVKIDQPVNDTRPDAGGEFSLLCLSRIDPIKNIECLLHAVARVSSRVPLLTLKIAGDGDPAYVTKLKSLAEELGISDRILWLGFIEGKDKARALRDASAFILPSLSESFGLAVVEALAVGLPCIVSKHVAISSEIAAHGAGIVVDATAHSIAEGIERLVGDENQLGIMSAAARRLVLDEFSIESMGRRLETLYQKILAPGVAA